jgi:hypothetical protein
LLTSHWRNPELAELDAVMVGISRGVPRWSLPYRYKLVRSLAPGDEAWQMEDEEAFEASYRAQLDELGAETILACLERISEQHCGKPLCLLCWERLDGSDPHEWCHRRVLADYLEQRTGTSILELAPGDLPRRPDIPQPSLFETKEDI